MPLWLEVCVAIAALIGCITGTISFLAIAIDRFRAPSVTLNVEPGVFCKTEDGYLFRINILINTYKKSIIVNEIDIAHGDSFNEIVQGYPKTMYIDSSLKKLDFPFRMKPENTKRVLIQITGAINTEVPFEAGIIPMSIALSYTSGNRVTKDKCISEDIKFYYIVPLSLEEFDAK